MLVNIWVKDNCTGNVHQVGTDGETYHTKVPYFSEYKFCPNCGAKMDVDADEQ